MRVAEAPIGSADPLLIFDSIGGEESAVRVDVVALLAAVPAGPRAAAGAECRVTIALGGVGRAQVDSLAVSFRCRGVAQRRAGTRRGTPKDRR